MTRIFFVTGKSGEFDVFKEGLPEEWDYSLGDCSSKEFGLSIIKNNSVDLVVVGSELSDCKSIDFVKIIMKEYPLINCAMVSDLSHDDFHEATEGYGLFMQIPNNADAEDGAKMVELYQSITGLMSA